MRRRPYTDTGIGRVPCERCGAPSITQWQICATGNQWAGVCLECDIDLNRLVVEFMRLPSNLGTIYAAVKRVLHNSDNSKTAKMARGKALTQP